MNHTVYRLRQQLLLPLLLALGLLAGCDHAIDKQLADKAATEKSLAISPLLFATRFNSTLLEVLADRKEDDTARMAPLFMLDTTKLVSDDYQYVFKAEVGPSRTAILGSLAKNGDLHGVGALLTQRTEGARAEFYLCAETISRVLTAGSHEKLPGLIKRLTSNALNNPGQRISETIGDKVLSAEIVKSGLLFQVEHE
jgi:hypothetical protein